MTIPFKRIIRSKANTKLFIDDLNIKLNNYGDEIDLLALDVPTGNQFRTIEQIYKSNDLRYCLANNLCELVTQDDDVINATTDPNLTATFPVTLWELTQNGGNGTGNVDLEQVSITIGSTLSETIDSFSTLTCRSAKWFFAVESASTNSYMSGEIIAVNKNGTVDYSEYSIVGDFVNYTLDAILDGDLVKLIGTNYEGDDIIIRTTKIPISTTTNYDINYGIGYGGVTDLSVYQPTKKTIIVIDGVQYYFYLEPIV